MSEYTPTTEEVRRQYRAPTDSAELTDPRREGESFSDYLGRVAGVDAFIHQQASYAAFDRWKARNDRQVAEKTLLDVADDVDARWDETGLGAVGASWIRARAEAYRQSGENDE